MRKRFLAALSFILLGLLLCIGIYEAVYPYTGEEVSASEKRHLAKKPALSLSSLLDGSFETGAEDFLLDHFPGREEAIRLSRGTLDALSLASWEEYAAVNEGNTNDMETAEAAQNEEDEDFFVPTPVPTAAPTLTPEPATPVPATPEPATPVPAEADTAPETTPSATPEPTATPKATKPPLDIKSFPDLVGIYLLHDGTTSQPDRYARGTVKNQSAIFSSLASLLPEDGQLVFTVVPNSTRASQLLTKEQPEGMHSDLEELVWACTSDKVETVSTADLLGARAAAGEYVFFTTDMHWTPLGALYVVTEMAARTGRAVAPLEAYTVTEESPFLGTLYRDSKKKQMKEHPDTLQILVPPGETRVYRYSSLTEYTEIPLIKTDAAENDRYTVYLGGSAGPWTRIENSAAEEGACLVICDSYGLCTLPMFATAYREVYYMDPRYYNKNAMAPLSTLIPDSGIRDIYVITGTLHAFDKSYFPSLAKFF